MNSDLHNNIVPFSDETVPGCLRGNLADISVTQLLSLIAIAKKTGALRFFEAQPAKGLRGVIRGGRKSSVLGDECGTIWFHKGSIVKAMVGQGSHHLVDVLHKARKLDNEQSEFIRERSVGKSEKALAIMLINADYLTHADIVSSLTQDTLDHVYQIMAWSEQFFLFEQDILPPDNELTVLLDTRQVVKNGALRTNEIRQLEQALPDLDFVLRFAEGSEKKLRDAQLSIHEWRVVAYVNREITVGQIAALCHMTEAEIRKVVVRLVNEGLVEMADISRWGLRKRHTGPLPKIDLDHE